MSTGDQNLDPTASTTIDEPGPAEAAEPKPKLDLDVQITDAGPCKKHLKVAISRADVERQFGESLGELRRGAAMPGFRPGRAPKQLVERRYRKEVAGQVKSALLMACMEQLDEDHKLNPISRPDLDVEAIELPDDGPLVLEMDIEVQPEFALPAYKAVRVQRPVRAVADADVEAQLKQFLERYAQLVPKLEGGAEPGDFVTADLAFHRDGQTLNEAKEVQFRLQPELRFQDGSIPDLADALRGARPGDSREARARIGTASPDPSLRGQIIGATIRVLDLKRLRLPEVNAAFLGEIGFATEEELRTALREVLERRFAYRQREAIRRQVLDQLVEQTAFELPPDLVARQERINLRREILTLRDSGATDADIRAREAEVRANIHQFTLQNLKEFFILSKIAEAEGIKVESEDLEHEIEAIADRNDESPRRVRARIDKEGLADALAVQILERKTIDRILEYAAFEDVPLGDEQPAVETLDQPAVAAPVEPADEAEAGGPAAEGGAPA